MTAEWYQERFGQMKIDFQTRRNHENEVLVLVLESGSSRVTYISVTSGGVAVVTSDEVRLYADWQKGDRFERMYHAMTWLEISEPLSPPQMAWSDFDAWEVAPPTLL